VYILILIDIYIYILIYLFIYLIYLSIYLFIYIYIYMHHLKTCISISTIKKPATIHRRTHLFPSNSNAPQGKSTSAEPQVIALGPKAAEGYLSNVNHGRNGKIDLGPPKACCEH